MDGTIQTGGRMDIIDRYRSALLTFGEHVHEVGERQWHLPTPCPEWDVRALVNHLVGENRWATELFAGRFIDDVGDALDGDLLGDDPLAAWRSSSAASLAAVQAPGAMDTVVHLSFGEFTGAAYTEQLFADLLIHGWDLARALGADESLDSELVAACSAWFAEWEDGYRGAGAVGQRTAVADEADPTGALLAAFGRHAEPDDCLSVLRRFNDAFGAHDVDGVMAMMTDDCVFEDTSPPHGNRHVGQAAVRAAWAAFFASSPSASFETEECVIAGNRATLRWCYRYDGGSVRGVDVFRVRDGKVAEKFSYVKG